MTNHPLHIILSLPESEIESYKTAFRYAAPKNHIPDKEKVYASRPLKQRRYGDVMVIMDLMEKDLIECFRKTFSIEKADLLQKKATEFFPAFNWLRDQVEAIAKDQKNFLNSGVDPKWVAAGGKDLDIFKSLNVLIPLAEKFGTTPKEVERWDYNFVFAILYRQVTENRVLKKYQELNMPT